ncbi:hypothetical protein Ahy_A07g037001 [Arachis hypogaea]|uniref:Aminotransferase-like plant mobile domain-containing protein n=1 Tax=Arachis hypogaea TaxID=3818 RepID=A0A445CHL4_ARAHY|nr:hypothetical protein Ahy_A07g037001 [Arachis hypogaea]
MQAIRNLLSRKFDLPDTFNEEPDPQNHILGNVNLAWIRRCRDTEPCDTLESVERYVRAHIFCVLKTVVFPDKLITSFNSKFLPLLWDFHQILAYSWRAASGVIGADIQDIYGGLLCILGEDSKAWELTIVLRVVHTAVRDSPTTFRRVAGEEVSANEPQQQQEESARPQQQVLSHEQQFQQAPYIPKLQPPQAHEPYIPQLVIPAEGHFSSLGGSDTISFSQVLRDTDYLFSTPPQEGPATSKKSGGRRATLGHDNDFDFDRSTGHVVTPGIFAPPRTQLFDLKEYPQLEEGDLGHELQHWYDLGGASALGMSGSGLYDTGGASMTDFGGPYVGNGLDAGVSQGHSYNLRTQTAPPDKYTPSLYSKKAPRK